MRAAACSSARRARERCRGETGIAGVLVLAMTGVLVLAGAVAVALAGAAVARQRAAGAADLAALAAASRALSGPGEACAAATTVARGFDARLERCRLVGLVAEVEAAVRPAGPLGRLGEARSRARAGPGPAPSAAR